MMISFELAFEVVQRIEPLLFKFPYPTRIDLVNRDRVKVVKLFPALPLDGDKIRFFKQGKMLRHRLSAHFQSCAQFAERLAALRMQTIEQLPAAGVG
jgi:hypothetical protein